MTSAAGKRSDDARARRIGVGCFTAFLGFWSGGIVGVLVAKIVGGVLRCTPPPGLPACHWYYYALGGMLVGAITLPILVIRRMRQR